MPGPFRQNTRATKPVPPTFAISLPKTAKNRLHIDVHAEPGGLDALVTRLETLGATRVEEFDRGPAGHWWVMRDPEGNEFCVA